MPEERAHRGELPRDRRRRELPRPSRAERSDVVGENADVDLLERDPVVLEPVAELAHVPAVRAARPVTERWRFEKAVGSNAEIHQADFRRSAQRAYLPRRVRDAHDAVAATGLSSRVATARPVAGTES